MSDSVAPPPDPDASTSGRPTLAAIFRAFIGVSLSGFGGALPWARRMIVDKRGWMTAEEFNEAFSLSQFLPGPNTVNFAVVFGTRFGGAAGAALALIGLLGPPVFIVTTLAVLYSRYGDLEALHRILAGIAAAAAGMLIAIAAKMVAPLLRKGLHWAPAVALVAFVCVALLQYPLPLVFLALAPFSIALAWFRG
jgi:chromate transporter